MTATPQSQDARTGGVWGLVLILSCAVAAAQTVPDRTHPPALDAPPRLVLPTIHQRTLSNGLRVWVVEANEVPIVQVNLVVKAGSSDDLPGQAGVASFTAAMLDEGAGARSALEIADEMELLGGTLATVSTFDASAIRLSVPIAQLAAAIEILADIARRPTFPPAEFSRLRQERLTTILQAQDVPASVAEAAFARAVFGPSHRYGTSPIGTEASIAALTRDDLLDFHAAHFGPTSAGLVVVGDVRVADVTSLFEASFGSWTGPARTRERPPPRPATPDDPELIVVDTPSSAQSQIRVGGVGVARVTPDYFPITVMNTIFGGAFTSRLNQNLREQHGYTYGAFSAFDMRLSPGPLVAAASVQTDKTAEALREFIRELHAMQTPVTDDELSQIKNHLALGFPGGFETTTGFARRLDELVVYDLPARYFERYMSEIQAVTVEDVLRVAMTYLAPTKMRIVVVGDWKAIRPGIEALGLGPARHMSVAEVFGNAPP